MKKLIIIIALALPLTGCESLRTLQDNPNVQFIEGAAVKLLASYYGNGGKVDAGWGITQGLNTLADFGTFRDLQAKGIPAQDTVRQQIKAFSGDPVAVAGLSSDLSKLVPANASPVVKAAATLAIAKGVQIATASADWKLLSPSTWPVFQ